MKRKVQCHSATSMLSDMTTIKSSIAKKGAKFLKLNAPASGMDNVRGIKSIEWDGNTILVFTGPAGDIVPVSKIKDKNLIYNTINRIMESNASDGQQECAANRQTGGIEEE